jgi:hypothetical protein
MADGFFSGDTLASAQVSIVHYFISHTNPVRRIKLPTYMVGNRILFYVHYQTPITVLRYFHKIILSQAEEGVKRYIF